MAEISKIVELPPALTEFTLFPGLPKERKSICAQSRSPETSPTPRNMFSNHWLTHSVVRFKIWAFSAREERILEICDSKDLNYHESDVQIRYYTPAPISAVLHVNHESRTIALENYVLSFPKGNSPAQIYYDPSVDILYFSAWCWDKYLSFSRFSSFENTLSAETKDTIRRIAIDNNQTFKDIGRWEEGTINN